MVGGMRGKFGTLGVSERVRGPVQAHPLISLIDLLDLIGFPCSK